MINKEFGSDFNYIEVYNYLKKTYLFESEKISLLFSGRVALFNLLNFGIKKYADIELLVIPNNLL